MNDSENLKKGQIALFQKHFRNTVNVNRFGSWSKPTSKFVVGKFWSKLFAKSK